MSARFTVIAGKDRLIASSNVMQDAIDWADAYGDTFTTPVRVFDSWKPGAVVHFRNTTVRGRDEDGEFICCGTTVCTCNHPEA